ncbi:hypothetical protein ABU186_10900 (plasmid) [Weissella paramesenteroides]
MYKAIVRRTEDFEISLSELTKSHKIDGKFEAEDKQQLIKKIAAFIKVTEKDLQDNFKDGTFVVGNEKTPSTNYVKYEIVVTDEQGKTVPLFD